MSNRIVMSDLFEELSIEAQEFISGGQRRLPPGLGGGRSGRSGPSIRGNTGRQGRSGGGATGYIIPDDGDDYYTWRLDADSF
ncbi:hypothetical protein [Nodularia sphaerocarpa]|uniref:hypothetical protein n=1 Tax=Nodularia sphaerocarpa TaxID=137816 RepID=UPI00232E3F72|nr:hypothetical protein [Nodularia sphaerocarpa]MDB9372365.1 hypothetical protein [Nodularia sphaerocarpa CS-585]MDB9377981.1 hypothetical protein [Nodularia sphaerocarpa CS-585A2]